MALESDWTTVVFHWVDVTEPGFNGGVRGSFVRLPRGWTGGDGFGIDVVGVTVWLAGAQGLDHRTIRNAGHFIQEDQPEACVQALLDIAALLPAWRQ